MTAPRRLARIVGLLVALSLPGVPAAAHQITEHDGRGDMVRVEEGGSDPQPAPSATVGDVVRTSFRHETGRVSVRTRLAALERTGRRFTVWVDVQDGAHHTWFVGVQATRRDRGGRTIVMDDRGRDLPCTADHRIDYVADTVQVSVPRRCLGDPARLRFRLLTEHVRRTWEHAWLDNGLAATMDDRRWTDWVAVG
ncbi:MAG TPA: hypothetical protein VGD39_20490 [Nocardioides sp.]|jgi:hypothetical protein